MSPTKNAKKIEEVLHSSQNRNFLGVVKGRKTRRVEAAPTQKKSKGGENQPKAKMRQRNI